MKITQTNTITMKKIAILMFISVTFSLVSCKKDEQPKEKPVMTYKVTEVAPTSTMLYNEYPTVLEGVVDVEIRSKVDGYIEKIFVDEGQEVRKGQVLFKLESETATQDAAAAKAKVTAAQVEVNRLIPLVERNIISQVQLETAKANLASAKSSYQSVITRINYATITSPVNGFVGTIPYRLGSYVSSATAQPLTRVSDISSVYAYFSINEKEQLDLMENLTGKTFQEKINNMPSVNLLLSNGSIYPSQGKIETFSGQANTQTGSYNVRAKFANTDKMIRSGSSGTIQIPSNLKDVILIPQSATMELQDKHLVLTYDNENKVKPIPVTIREVPGGKFYVVDSGLKAGDKIILEGVGILAEGTPIKPELVPYAEVIKTEQK